MNHFIPRWPHERIFAYVVVSIPCLCMCSPLPRTPQQEHIAAWALSRVSIFMYTRINIRCEMTEKEKSRASQTHPLCSPRPPCDALGGCAALSWWHWAHFGREKWRIHPLRSCSDPPPFLPTAGLGINNFSNHLRLTLSQATKPGARLGPVGEIANQKQRSPLKDPHFLCAVLLQVSSDL